MSDINFFKKCASNIFVEILSAKKKKKKKYSVPSKWNIHGILNE